MSLNERPVLRNHIALANEVTQVQIREAEKMALKFEGADANTHAMLVAMFTQALALNLNAVEQRTR